MSTTNESAHLSNGVCAAPRTENGADHASPSPSSTAFGEFWQFVRRQNRRIALAAGAGIVLALVACFVSGARYDSTAQMLVIKKRLETTPITGPDQTRAADDYLSTHML